MKFKAFLTDHGITLLERRLLPALDKLDKTCVLYLTPQHTLFLHNLLSSSTVIQSVAQVTNPALFLEHRISSQCDDRIALTLDASLLLRALRSVATISSSSPVQIKLVKKLPPSTTQPMPFLSFETKGRNSAVIHDVPISKPFSRSQVLELQAAIDGSQTLPKTLVQIPSLNQLMSLMERMRHVGDSLNVGVSKYGDLHLEISTPIITLGTEFQRLLVLGERAEPPAASDPGASPGKRMAVALQGGDGMMVQVTVKNFVKSLSCHLAKPDCAFYGIEEQSGCLVVVFQFFIPGTRITDKAISLHCRIPVIDPGCN